MLEALCAAARGVRGVALMRGAWTGVVVLRGAFRVLWGAAGVKGT